MISDSLQNNNEEEAAANRPEVEDQIAP